MYMWRKNQNLYINYFNAKVAGGLLVYIITWCNKFGTDPRVPFISSREAPRTTRIHLEWNRLGSISPSCNLWSGDHIYGSDLDNPNKQN